MNDNYCQISGNVTDDPEIRFLDDEKGTALCNFSIAHSTRVPDGKGGFKDGVTSYFRCTAWRQLAENIAATLTKGMRVTVSGHLQQRRWETKPEDGSKPENRSSVEIQVDELGVNLRWATATVEKNPKTGGNGNGGRAEDAPVEEIAKDAKPF